MTCKDIRPLLDAYRTGELPEDIITQVRKHLTDCEACHGHLRTVSEIAKEALTMIKSAPIKVSIPDNNRDQYGKIDTDFGPVWIAFVPKGITAVKVGVEDDAAFEAFYKERLGRKPSPGKIPDKFIRPVVKALNGEKIKNPPVSIEGLSKFEQDVLSLLAQVPLGEVRPYAWLAKEAGNPGAVRAVGTIMARNPIPFLLPCHRIVPTTGGVGNYGYGPDMKRTLLEREGVSPSDLEAWKRQRIRYIGSRTTGIYCYPTCRDARRISWENQVPFSTENDASEMGYRPCKHCRPIS